MSLTSFAYQDFQPAADFATRLAKHLGENSFPLPLLLNGNVPPVAFADIKGVKTPRLGMRCYHDIFRKAG